MLRHCFLKYYEFIVFLYFRSCIAFSVYMYSPWRAPDI
jgi:hypothetical protein